MQKWQVSNGLALAICHSPEPGALCGPTYEVSYTGPNIPGALQVHRYAFCCSITVANKRPVTSFDGFDTTRQKEGRVIRCTRQQETMDDELLEARYGLDELGVRTGTAFRAGSRLVVFPKAEIDGSWAHTDRDVVAYYPYTPEHPFRVMLHTLLERTVMQEPYMTVEGLRQLTRHWIANPDRRDIVQTILADLLDQTSRARRLSASEKLREEIPLLRRVSEWIALFIGDFSKEEILQKVNEARTKEEVLDIVCSAKVELPIFEQPELYTDPEVKDKLPSVLISDITNDHWVHLSNKVVSHGTVLAMFEGRPKATIFPTKEVPLWQKKGRNPTRVEIVCEHPTMFLELRTLWASKPTKKELMESLSHPATPAPNVSRKRELPDDEEEGEVSVVKKAHADVKDVDLE